MKKLLLYGLLASFLGALYGCASDKPQTTTSTTSTTTEQTTVRPASQ
ncbi:MAG: hypothetical protein PHD76_02960 [Methylacidiphilales bacterium]|nr:hypothetical protein [Candidatus Methylacidiphilales bacterium]